MKRHCNVDNNYPRSFTYAKFVSTESEGEREEEREGEIERERERE